MFEEIPKLIHLHEEFLYALKDILKNWRGERPTFDEGLKKLIPYMQLYNEYLERVRFISEKIEELVKAYPVIF